MGRTLRFILGIPAREVACARRGFQVAEPRIETHLERIGQGFLHGYHAALETHPFNQLVARLDEVAGEYRGFAYEGAGMALALLDGMTPWNSRRLARFIAGPGSAHVYLLHVGMGWALARFPFRISQRLAAMDSRLRWLALDGYGFHEGYFHWRKYLPGGSAPRRLKGYACRAFDQGLGRSLWFVKGADVEEIARAIATFPRARHGDLWSGIGLACGYAGKLDRPSLAALRHVAAAYLPELAQGVAFAAKARLHAGIPAAHTEEACRVLCQMGAETAAAVTDRVLGDLPPDGALPAYEVWRRCIAQIFSTKEGAH